MEHQDESLQRGQRAADHRINKHGACHRGPEQKSAMPQFRLIVRIFQHDETLDERAGQVASRRNQSLPSRHSQPAGKIAQDLPTRRRRQHRGPVILTLARRSHGRHLGQCQEDSQGTDPGEDEAVD